MATISPTGIYQPEGGDAAGLAAIWKAQNDSLDPITVPQFPSTTARDAAVAAITSRAGSPPPFRSCYINGFGWTDWSGTAWVLRPTAGIVLAEWTRSSVATINGATLEVTSGTIVRNTGFTASASGNSAGSMITQSPGWYTLTFSGLWAANGTGRRLVAIIDSTTTTRDVLFANTGVPDSTGSYHTAVWEGFIPAGVGLMPRIIQNSGGNLSMSSIRFTARLSDPRVS